MAVWWPISVCGGVGGARGGGAGRRWLGPLVLAVSLSLVESAGSSAASRLPLPGRGVGGLRLRGGASAFSGVEFVSPPIDTPWLPSQQEPEVDEEAEVVDKEIMLGDMFGIDEDDHEELKEQFHDVADQVHI
ncbi:hypothetical protein T484DRAFT_1766621 [Baffinella frigidus]|nr:hypothetical protein T484DRAFT_1766621 [Cryptophyta sp. CCMP2293]